MVRDSRIAQIFVKLMFIHLQLYYNTPQWACYWV